MPGEIQLGWMGGTIQGSQNETRTIFTRTLSLEHDWLDRVCRIASWAWLGTSQRLQHLQRSDRVSPMPHRLAARWDRLRCSLVPFGCLLLRRHPQRPIAPRWGIARPRGRSSRGRLAWCRQRWSDSCSVSSRRPSRLGSDWTDGCLPLLHQSWPSRLLTRQSA